MNNKNLDRLFQRLERAAKPRRKFVHYLQHRLTAAPTLQSRLWLAPVILTPLIVTIVIVAAWPQPQAVIGLDRTKIIQALQTTSFVDPDKITHYKFVTTIPHDGNTQEDMWYSRDNLRVYRTSHDKIIANSVYSSIYSKSDDIVCGYSSMSKVESCSNLTKHEAKYIISDLRHNLFNQPNANIPFTITLKKINNFLMSGTGKSFILIVQWTTPQPIIIGQVINHDDPTDVRPYPIHAFIGKDKTVYNKYQNGVYHHFWKRSLNTKDHDIYLQVRSDNDFSSIIQYDVTTKLGKTVAPNQIPLLQNEITQFSVEQSMLVESYLLLPQFLSKNFNYIPKGLLTFTTGEYHGRAATAVTIPNKALSTIDSTNLFLNTLWSDLNRSTQLWFSTNHTLLGYTTLETDGTVVSDTTIQREVLSNNLHEWFSIDAWKRAMSTRQ